MKRGYIRVRRDGRVVLYFNLPVTDPTAPVTEKVHFPVRAIIGGQVVAEQFAKKNRVSLSFILPHWVGEGKHLLEVRDVDNKLLAVYVLEVYSRGWGDMVIEV